MMLPSALTGMVVMWSQLTTASADSPLAALTDTSVDSPRISPVMGATVTVRGVDDDLSGEYEDRPN